MKGPQLFLKAVVVGVLALLLLIPLAMINGTIAERASYRQEAIQTVARSSAGAQVVAGPVLVLPYEDARVYRGADGTETLSSARTAGRVLVFPDKLAVTGELVPEVRELGLHKVRLYEWRARLAASFRPDVAAVTGDPSLRRFWGTPYLSVSLADVRGLAGTPALTVDGKPVAMRSGVGAHRDDGGLHALLPSLVPGSKSPIATTLDLGLTGTEMLSIVPIGDSNDIRLQSPWPHPQFAGSFLPSTRDRRIDASGFDARWNITALAAASQRQYRDDVALGELERLDVSLVDPVNIYSQADRASKYGVLFVALTFAGFFMFELIKRLPIHPVQYGLVGLALALFFLLLLSLSEHIEFWQAYLVASVACIGLLGFYLTAVLRSVARGVGFAAMLTVLYGALYGLLVSEDNALVLGSLLLFAILAAVMVLTRRIDWYALGRGEPAPRPVPPPRAEAA
jgi:inner membrane protein